MAIRDLSGIAAPSPGTGLLSGLAPGVVIRTHRGDVKVEAICAGDMVLTRDHGFQPVLWAGSVRFSRDELSKNKALRPVSLAGDCIAPNVPGHDIRLARDHRVLVRSPSVQLHFGVDEALAPCQVFGGSGKMQWRAEKEFSYHHLVFARHEVIWTSGLWAESLLDADLAFETGGTDAAGFLPTRLSNAVRKMRAARLCLTSAEARLLDTSGALAAVQAQRMATHA